MVEVAGFISSHPHTVRETGGAKGKTAEAKGSPKSIYAGTQQNMLRTVTETVESYRWFKVIILLFLAMRFVFRISHGFFRPFFRR